MVLRATSAHPADTCVGVVFASPCTNPPALAWRKGSCRAKCHDWHLRAGLGCIARVCWRRTCCAPMSDGSWHGTHLCKGACFRTQLGTEGTCTCHTRSRVWPTLARLAAVAGFGRRRVLWLACWLAAHALVRLWVEASEVTLALPLATRHALACFGCPHSQRARLSSFARLPRRTSSRLKSASARFAPFLEALHFAHASCQQFFLAG